MFVGDATASNGTDGAGEMRVSQAPTGRPKRFAAHGVAECVHGAGVRHRDVKNPRQRREGRGRATFVRRPVAWKM